MKLLLSVRLDYFVTKSSGNMSFCLCVENMTKVEEC